MIVANATGMQVANAFAAFATVRAVASLPAPDQTFRRERLRELAQHSDFGNNSALAKALGYTGPAYVRQMIAGERSITEKTISVIDTMRGGKFKGWFSQAGAPLDADPWPLDPFITREQWMQLAQAERSAVAWEASKVLRQMRPSAPAVEGLPSNVTPMGDQDHLGGLRKTAKQKARSLGHKLNREGNQ